MKHIAIKGKSLCCCRFSDAQKVKLVNELSTTEWQTNYEDENDPKLALTLEALRKVVKDPATVAVLDGPAHPVPSAGMPVPGMPGMVFLNKEQAMALLKGQNPGRAGVQPLGLPGLPPQDLPPQDEDDAGEFSGAM